MNASPRPVTFAEAFRFWLKLGFISFGGPAGQIAIMHKELVEKRRWISETHFLHALNFCMLLPGPEATQLAIYCGWRLHGLRGGLAAGIATALAARAPEAKVHTVEPDGFDDMARSLAIGRMSWMAPVGQTRTHSPHHVHPACSGFPSAPTMMAVSAPRSATSSTPTTWMSSHARTQREHTMHLDESNVKYGLEVSLPSSRWFAPA